MGGTSHKKFELKNRILPSQLQWINSQDLRVIISLDKLCPANALLALPRFYAMVLHSPGRVCSSAVHITKL